ncbi:hypothetical protein DL93DRAFT_2084122 [Clavulina sp. PMI_390]|nr:hypothetical protein DL93DRAFT_2084122 [Clavulina sp. PMI_390]
MSATVASVPRAVRSSRGGPHRSSRPQESNSSPAAVATNANESEELRALRAKFGSKLKTLKELFPTWSDEDLLSTLNDVNGSVETAVGHISEGAYSNDGLIT